MCFLKTPTYSGDKSQVRSVWCTYLTQHTVCSYKQSRKEVITTVLFGFICLSVHHSPWGVCQFVWIQQRLVFDVVCPAGKWIMKWVMLLQHIRTETERSPLLQLTLSAQPTKKLGVKKRKKKRARRKEDKNTAISYWCQTAKFYMWMPGSIL